MACLEVRSTFIRSLTDSNPCLPLLSRSCAVKLPPNYLTTITTRAGRIYRHISLMMIPCSIFPSRSGRVLILTHDTKLFTNACEIKYASFIFPLLNPRIQCSKRQVEEQCARVCVAHSTNCHPSVTHSPSLCYPDSYPSNCIIVPIRYSPPPPLCFVHPTPSRNHMVLYGPTRCMFVPNITQLSRSNRDEKSMINALLNHF
jgi:hypothetical protein